MKMLAVAVWACLAASAGEEGFAVTGRVRPAAPASVSLHGTGTPFQVSTLAGADGRFKFKGIARGSYTLSVFVPGQGEARRTIDVGPAAAGGDGAVEVEMRLDSGHMTPDQSSVISMRELSIPEAARKAYREAEKRLARKDVRGAVAQLKRATELAPQFSAAWNHLGTIAYQTGEFQDAERYFRRALEADNGAYEPLVNLGGALVTMGRFEESWHYNTHAVLQRPKDALAQSQMGMTYFGLERLDLAERHLREACKLDPGHFSHPQRMLAEIYLRKGQKWAAAEQLEEFLKYHPDWPLAGVMRRRISELRGSPAI